MATTEFTPGEIKVLIQTQLRLCETRVRTGLPAADVIESAAKLVRQIDKSLLGGPRTPGWTPPEGTGEKVLGKGRPRKKQDAA